MLWKVSCIKGNGQPRAQFLQWSVPKALRDALQLNDGDSCKIKVSLGNFDRTDSYQLTSGGEFRMAKDVAESLQEEIKGNPNREVSFELLIDGMLSKIADDFENQVRESVALNINERQKRLSSAKSIPESYQAQVTLFRRNPDVVALES